MRTEIFTEAWRLYRMYNMTFAQALSLAWSKYKSDKLANTLNLADALGHKETVKACIAEIKTINEKINSFSLTLRVEVKSNGARHDYMTGRYMGD